MFFMAREEFSVIQNKCRIQVLKHRFLIWIQIPKFHVWWHYSAGICVEQHVHVLLYCLSGWYLVPRCCELHMIIIFLFKTFSWILMGNPMVGCFRWFGFFFSEWASVTDKLNYDGILFLREIKIPLCLSRCLPGDIYCKYVKFVRITSFLTVNTTNWKQLSHVFYVCSCLSWVAR